MSNNSRLNLGFSKQHSVIITGGGSGIGRSTALLADQAGLNVIIWDIDTDAANNVRAQIQSNGGSCIAQTVDIAIEQSVTEALEQVITKEQLRVPFLVNNAGPPSAAQLDFGDALAASLNAVHTVTESWLRAAGDEATSLVNVSSVAGSVIGTTPDWYCAAKAGIAGYTRHLAFRGKSTLRANAVCPGMVNTPRIGNFLETSAGIRAVDSIPASRLAEPEEVAGPILFLLSPLSSYISGESLVVDGGWTTSP